MSPFSTLIVVSDSIVEMRAFVRPIQGFFAEVRFVKQAVYLRESLEERSFCEDDGCLVFLDLREHSELRHELLEGSFKLGPTQRVWIKGPTDSFYRREFYKLGCDFYLDNHTHSLDLYAKVQGLQGVKEPRSIQSSLPEGLRLDVSMQQLYSGGESVGLSSTEFRIFVTLLESSSKHLKREEIRDRVWGQDFKMAVRSIDSHISRMRRKIPETLMRIEADRNKGYRLQHRSA